MDRLHEFLDDLRDHWDDHYWWARRPMLQAALIAVITGLLGVMFAYLEVRVRAAAAPSPGGTL